MRAPYCPRENIEKNAILIQRLEDRIVGLEDKIVGLEANVSELASISSAFVNIL